MFKVGDSYTKHDIYRILNVPIERQKGAWDTGYRKYDDDFYVFVNIDNAGRTGHDYDNHWEGENLVWYAKTGTTIRQLIIRELLDNNSTVNIFTRTNDRSPFTYQGEGKVQSYEDVTPVKITWQINNHRS
jgi:5-methylcytosine-specific restriction protein A